MQYETKQAYNLIFGGLTYETESMDSVIAAFQVKTLRGSILTAALNPVV